jgi:hypothetical protein
VLVQWVTRSNIRVNRAATSWLILRFIDPAASFRFVEPEEVAELERRDGALGFDAPGARYPHQDRMGRCSFEALVQECFPCEPALRELSRIVHWADFPDDIAGSQRPPALAEVFDRLSLASVAPAGSPHIAMLEAIGLRTIARGFPLVARDDHETVERSAFLYDALYASVRTRLER